MKKIYFKNNASGLTLIELMIAMALSLFVMGGAVGLFISSKQAYRTQDAMSRNQEAGRFATAALSRQIRSAGYAGCSSLEVTTPNVVAQSVPSFKNSSSIIGYDGGSGWTPPSTYTLIPNTDVIVVSSAGGCGADVSTNMGVTDAGIQVANAASCGFKTDDKLLITDCETADVFLATGVSALDDIATIAHADSSNTTDSLSRAYKTGSTVLRFLQTTYFVGMPKFDDSKKYRPNPALYRIDVNGVIEEVVDNVQDMQIEYGVDTGNDGVVDIYKKASAVTDWGRVFSVRLSLLIRSDEGAISESQTIRFNGADVNAGDDADKRLRSIFSTTVSIRNRLP